jgi:nitrile hydratase
MDGIHDMGGMHGFGPVEREENEPLFHREWERRVLGIAVATPVPVPGGSRNNIENMNPAHYLASTYYEKWLHSRVKGLIDAGALTADELETRMALFRNRPDAETPVHPNPDGVRADLASRRPAVYTPSQADVRPQFQKGDRVRALNIHPEGHTRLPRYVRGKTGTITRFYGIHDLQDAELPHGCARREQALYAVRFASRELWGESAEARNAVYLDMWESYLEAV